MKQIQAKGILSAKNGMNVYRGCTHGCIYCDARSLCYHTPIPFEDIEAKINAPELLEKALKHLNQPSELLEMTLSIVSPEQIRELNKQFRDVDAVTDVLSFPMFLPDELDDPMEIPVPLGDIVISLERAEEQAAELGNTPLREIAFLAVHSTLHLLGYDHEASDLGEEIMCHKQRLIIGKLK